MAANEPVGQPEEVLLAHALKHWDAEVENARRHGTRMAGILTLSSAVLGVGLFNLGNISKLDGSLASAVLKVCLALALFYVGIALLAGISARGSAARPSASHLLGWLPTDLAGESSPFDLTRQEALQLAYGRTLAAVQDLQEQNVAEQDRIDRVQEWLGWAGFFAGAGILFFLLATIQAAPKNP